MRRAIVALVVALCGVAGGAPTHAAVELDVSVSVHFSGSCAETSGHWGVWNATIDPDRAALFDEYPPEPVTWSPTMPILGEFVGGPSQMDHDFRLVLFAADRTTVLFETGFRLVGNEGTPYWSVDTTLDCATTPYSEVAQPDAAMPSPSPGWPTPVGFVLLSVGAVVLLLRQIDRARDSG